jgi:NitT/TauT family transport system permease protein
MKNRRKIDALAWQLVIVGSVLAVWQWGFDLTKFHLLDPYFLSKPSEIGTQFLQLSCMQTRMGDWIGDMQSFRDCLDRYENNLWGATYVTMKNTFFGFVYGVASGYFLGVLIGRSGRLSEIFEPLIVALNSVPRIALAPIILLAFGIGDASKIVTSWLVVVFLVFFNVFEGARTVDRSYINASRLLGATPWQITRTVVVPSTMAWLFASLTPAISFALIGVVVGEFIGAERGIGRLIIESEARADAAGMMVAVVVLMVIGMLLTATIKRLQDHLLRWQDRSID